MKKENLLLILGGLALAILLFGAISLILPNNAYTRTNMDGSDAYILVYKNTVLWSYGDSIIESEVQKENIKILTLKYKEPGEKGSDFRNELTLSETSATMNATEYTERSPWIIFNPGIYKNPFEYFLTITTMRQGD